METLTRDVPSSMNHFGANTTTTTTNSSGSNMKHSYVQLSKTCLDEDAQINKKLPKELLLRIFSYLDVVSLCRCAQVSRAWNVLALDGSNWQKIDLFDFQTDVEGPVIENISRRCGGFLRQISLRGCQSVGDGSLKTLAQCCNYIEYINLNGCKRITDSTSQSLSQYCKKLLSLDIGSCSMVTDLSLKAISDGCPNLTSVNISWCDGITENGVEALAHGCPKLKSFISKGCTRMTTRAISCLAQHCVRLEVINLHGCNKIEDDAVIMLANNCNSLKYICLANCSLLTDNCLVALAEQCYQLNTLEVAGCSQFTDIGFLALSKTCHLMEKMDLEECVFITDSTLFHLAMGCPRLEYLSLSHCELITDEGIRHLSTSTCASEHLAVLELDNCPLITDTSLEHLINCHNLQRIMLYDCQLITRNGIKRLRFWKTISDEHGIDGLGMFVGDSAETQLDRIHVHYDETPNKVYVPRAVLVDTDPTALNAISSGGGIVFRPGNLVIGDGGTDGNWARGYYAADGVPGLVLSAIRSEAERCDRLQGFQIVHSLSGGTGSGLGARVVDAIRQTFPGRTVNTFSVVPRWWSAVTGRGALQAVSETYNATLSAARLIDAAHNTYVADNRTLYDTCAGPAMNIDAPSYDDLNHLVTQTMSGVTTGLRFTGGDLNADMRKCTANLVPYPRMHFFAPVFAPYTYRGQTDGRAHTVTELGQRLFAAVTSRCVNRRRRRPRPPPTRAGDDDDALPVIVMAAAITFRGEGLQRSAADDKRRVAAVVAALPSWLPDNVKTAYYDVPSRGLRTSGTVVANTTAVADAFDAVGGRYAAALAKKSFLRPYTDEGMTVDDFKYALEQIETLTADYRSLEDGDYHRRREL